MHLLERIGLEEPSHVALLVAVVVLGSMLAAWIALDLLRYWGARAVYQEFAAMLGLPWIAPDNPVDRLHPGKIEGRYRDRKLTVTTTRPNPSIRHAAPRCIVRVHLGKSLRAGLHAGSGEFRARKPGNVPLPDRRLFRRLRPKGKDTGRIVALLSSPEVAEALTALDRATAGVGLDDGTLSCCIALPRTPQALRTLIDRMIEVAGILDRRAAS